MYNGKIMKKSRDYPPFHEWKWKTYDRKKTVELDEFIERHTEDVFFIGIDSQNYLKRRRTCVFTTALIAYTQGKGGNIILHTDTVPAITNLRPRLLIEAMRSLEIAWYLSEKIPAENLIGIHLDVNKSLKFKSGQYHDELSGYIMAQGFKCFTKPDAWAASSTADKVC